MAKELIGKKMIDHVFNEKEESLILMPMILTCTNC